MLFTSSLSWFSGSFPKPLSRDSNFTIRKRSSFSCRLNRPMRLYSSTKRSCSQMGTSDETGFSSGSVVRRISSSFRASSMSVLSESISDCSWVFFTSTSPSAALLSSIHSLRMVEPLTKVEMRFSFSALHFTTHTKAHLHFSCSSAQVFLHIVNPLYSSLPSQQSTTSLPTHALTANTIVYTRRRKGTSEMTLVLAIEVSLHTSR